ncbi:MAG TPA: thioesterase [Dongiaceae bacterium]|nr:thioesterase [Dongiaceae bacterium]
MNSIAPGLIHRRSITVDRSVTVPALPRLLGDLDDMPAVLATAAMVGLVETTCIEALKPFGEGQKTVDTHVDLSHVAATPVGMKVTAEVELVAVEGRKLRFRVECRDEKEVIGAGFHERHVIDAARFLARLQAKAP